LSNPDRFALEEAVPSPTDVSPENPRIHKKHFNVPVVIESNDVLFTIRSDSLSNLQNVSGWLQGSTDILNGQHIPSPDLSKLFMFTSSRLMFLQIGLPRKLADANSLSYTQRVNPASPMWMGFADQQVDGAGPAEITTFQGNSSARFTDTKPGDYFFDGSIQHLSHVIQDLQQFYANKEPFTERCQYMFRSDPIPSTGNQDQFKDSWIIFTKGEATPRKTPGPFTRTSINTAWGISPVCSVPHVLKTVLQYIFAWMGLALIRWMYPVALISQSSNSRFLCPRRTFSSRCVSMRLRWTWCRNTACRMMRMGWSAF